MHNLQVTGLLQFMHAVSFIDAHNLGYFYCKDINLTIRIFLRGGGGERQT